jgi:hypothetical protein
MVRVHRRGDTVDVVLRADEVLLLRALASQIVELLDAGAHTIESAEPTADSLEAMVGLADEPVETPRDPALLRLLPDAYAEDPAASDEFRRLMDADLRQSKTDALGELLAALPDHDGTASLSLSPVTAETWIQAVNDIRLVIGVRLDVQEDMDAVFDSMTRDDPRLPVLLAYHELTSLQQELIEAVE